jgi:hypothetical protein
VDQGPLPFRPETPQSNVKETIGTGKPLAEAMSRQDHNLLSQSQVFQERMTQRAFFARKEMKMTERILRSNPESVELRPHDFRSLTSRA